MSRQQWLSIIGVWVMVFLKLGFPSAWDEPFAIATGLLIILISFKMGAKRVSKNPPHNLVHHQSTYVENGTNAEKPLA